MPNPEAPPIHERVLWPGGRKNCLFASVIRRSSDSWVVVMRHDSLGKGICVSDTSARKAWNRALRFMLDPNAIFETPWRLGARQC